MIRVGKNKYSVRPNISWKAYFLNIAMKPLQVFRIGKDFEAMSLERFKKIAKKIAKYDDFEDYEFEEPFKYVIRKTIDDGFSPLGYAAARDFFIRRLSVKLRVNKELADPIMKPALDTPVRRPIFVTGMPRTGTTFLHRLLAMDPAARSPYSYELLDPVQRYRDDVDKDSKTRIKYLQKALDVMHMIIPFFKNIHEVGATLPEECLMSMGSDIPLFFSTFHICLCDNEGIENYFSWNHNTAYKNYYKVLQLMQYQAERNNTPQKGQRWVLKCPVHINQLDSLVEAFPDAAIVWTHRDMKDAVPSMCSFVRGCMDMYVGRDIQLNHVGKDMLHYANKSMAAGHKFFKKHSQKANPHVNIKYKDLISNPVETVRQLYKDLGYEFTAEYEEILQKFVDDDKRHRAKMKNESGGKKLHTYSLEMFGLTEEDIDNSLSWYEKEYLGI